MNYEYNDRGNLLVPATPESFTYDADGNLTSDSLWTNFWNAENRLIATESRAGLPTAAKMREEWTCLPDGRWIERVVWTNNGTAFYRAYTNRYIWDGQVLLALLDHTNGLVMSFMRGLDLSGSFQGAGGVGGLLAVNFKNDGTHFAAYDGNGNVAALVSAADGSETARYEYDPFGQTLRMSGPLAKANPIRFSTQYADDVRGTVKYLHRDYEAPIGRWLSRDPIDERGLKVLTGNRGRFNRDAEKNLYGFVGNNPITRIDRLGLDYYIIQVEGVCGVHHRVFVGDDGNGGAYTIDILPTVVGTYDPRRLCGRGVINYYPRSGSATNWFTGMINMEKHVTTTADQDKQLAANAKSLDGRHVLYCLYVQDCRAIETCTLQGKTLGQRVADELGNAVEQAFNAVFGSTDGP